MNTDTKPTQLWQSALVVMIAALFGVMLASGCEGLGVYLALVVFACVVAPIAVFLMGYSKNPLASNISRFSFGGFILFGTALAIGGLLGIYRNESFLSGAETIGDRPRFPAPIHKTWSVSYYSSHRNKHVFALNERK